MSEHYRKHPSGIEAKQITDHCSFNIGNVFKYLFRYEHKGTPIEDLRKARSYLDFEIAKLERESRPTNEESDCRKALDRWEKDRT